MKGWLVRRGHLELDFLFTNVLRDGEKWLLDAGFFFYQCVKLKDGEKWLLDAGFYFFYQCVKGW